MELSPSAQRIRALAVEHFAEHGYDGSSLSTIAEAAGMRKASLYSHFANKDALFGAALEHAVGAEMEYATTAFTRDAADLHGFAYLATIGDRYASSATLRFLLRAAYAPPAPMREEVARQHRALLSHVGGLFRAALGSRSPEAVATLVEGYLGAVDALHVEAIFGQPELLERRRTALWRMIENFDQTTAG